MEVDGTVQGIPDDGVFRQVTTQVLLSLAELPDVFRFSAHFQNIWCETQQMLSFVSSSTVLEKDTGRILRRFKEEFGRCSLQKYRVVEEH